MEQRFSRINLRHRTASGPLKETGGLIPPISTKVRGRKQAPVVEDIPEVTAEVFGETSEPGPQSNPDEWALVVRDNKAHVNDEEMAKRLGYGRARDLKPLIERMDKSGKLPGLLTERHVTRYESRPGVYRDQEVTRYLLNERNALKVIRHCETDTADKIYDEVTDVFLAHRHGKLQPQQQLAKQDSTLALAEALRKLVDSLPARIADAVNNRLQIASTGPSVKSCPAPESLPEGSAAHGLAPTIDNGFSYKLASYRGVCRACSKQLFNTYMLWKKDVGGYCLKCSQALARRTVTIT